MLQHSQLSGISGGEDYDIPLSKAQKIVFWPFWAFYWPKLAAEGGHAAAEGGGENLHFSSEKSTLTHQNVLRKLACQESLFS